MSCREGKEEWLPIDSTPYCSTSAFDAASPLLHEVVVALDSLNITVEQVQMKLNVICSNSGDEISVRVTDIWLCFFVICVQMCFIFIPILLATSLGRAWMKNLSCINSCFSFTETKIISPMNVSRKEFPKEL